MNSRPHAVPAIIAGVLLLLAIGEHPHGYFTLLRWVVAVAGVVVAVTAWKTAAQWITWVFGGIALLFNPLAPIYLDRATWRPIDIACGLAFLAVAAGLTAAAVSNDSD